MTQKTALIYCTYGILVKKLQSKETQISHIIIDEVHERNEASDLLFVILKEHLQRMASFKIILMSATANVKTFLDFFPGAAYIEGV